MLWHLRPCLHSSWIPNSVPLLPTLFTSSSPNPINTPSTPLSWPFDLSIERGWLKGHIYQEFINCGVAENKLFLSISKLNVKEWPQGEFYHTCSGTSWLLRAAQSLTEGGLPGPLAFSWVIERGGRALAGLWSSSYWTRISTWQLGMLLTVVWNTCVAKRWTQWRDHTFFVQVSKIQERSSYTIYTDQA